MGFPKAWFLRSEPIRKTSSVFSAVEVSLHVGTQRNVRKNLSCRLGRASTHHVEFFFPPTTPRNHHFPILFHQTRLPTTMAAFGTTSNGINCQDPPPLSIDDEKGGKRDGGISSTIQLELQQLQGELFDISDTSSSVAIILTKVQQLTDFENRIMEEQRLEIERLSGELKELRIQHVTGRSGMTDGLESLPSFGNIAPIVSSISSTTSLSSSSSSSSSDGYTNESERATSYSLFANENLATKVNNSSLVTAEISYSKGIVRELEEKIRSHTDELEELSSLKSGIVAEIEELKSQSRSLVKERNKLIQEVEVYTHQSELAIQLESAQEQNARLQQEIEELRTALDMYTTSTKETEHEQQQILDNKLLVAEHERAKFEDIAARAEERARTEEMVRKEMESEMQSLYKEKIALQKKIVATNVGGSEIAKSTATIGGEDIPRLKEEIQALRVENASLRSTSQRDYGAIAALKDETLKRFVDPAAQMECCQNQMSTTEEQSASRKRTLINSQGSVGEEDERSREHKRQHDQSSTNGSGCLELIDGSTRVRSYAGGSDTLDGDTVSAIHDADSVSLLFGPNSVDGFSRKLSPNIMEADSVPCDECNFVVKSTADHDVIRAHAEKVLYWANRATERSKSGCSSLSSITSRQEVKERRGGDGSMTTPKNSEASSPSPSPIPETIGLPPRSQTRVRSQLPPRCPLPTSASVFVTTSSSSSGEGETLDCNSDSSSSEKENGEVSFDRQVLGAFPTLSSTKNSRQQKKKKNCSVVETDNVIHNLNNLDREKLCCECSASPFSGNDPQSEFYLPKLGLACNCAGSTIMEERESFSKNPTALSNILRPWQCAFLETLSITTADELLNAHRAGANAMARKMKNWRAMQGGNKMTVMRSRECYVALKVWSCTCKVVLRSIREQKEQARRRRSREDHVEGAVDVKDIIIVKPHFLDISLSDMHTITSISTLGQPSECGRPFEMMEI